MCAWACVCYVCVCCVREGREVMCVLAVHGDGVCYVGEAPEGTGETGGARGELPYSTTGGPVYLTKSLKIPNE